MYAESLRYKPFRYPQAVEMTIRHDEVHWVPEEADLSNDVSDWKMKLTESDRDLITNILRLFTTMDVAVGSYYYDHLIPAVKSHEIRTMLGGFASREGIHQRAYALLNDTLNLPESDYHAFMDYREMRDKIEHIVSEEFNSSKPMRDALMFGRSVFNEGVSLFGIFAVLLSYQRFAKMRGMGSIVEWSIRDETLHINGNSMVFHWLCEEHPEIVCDELKSKLYAYAQKTVELEDSFLDLAFHDFVIEGIDKKEVKEFVRFLTDRRLRMLGLKPIYGISNNPLKWIDAIISGTSHTNFFEARVTDYSVNAMVGDWEWDEPDFDD
jgi:glutaredoxin 3